MSDEVPTEPAYAIVLSDVQLEHLGRFTAIWSQIDSMLFQVISLAGRTAGKNLRALIEGTTTGQRLNMLRRLIPHIQTSDGKVKAEKLCSSLGALIDKRNHIMHGVWGLYWDFDKDKLHPACSYEKAPNVPLYARQLPELCERAANLSWKMYELILALDPRAPNLKGVPARFIFNSKPPPNRRAPKWQQPPARRSSQRNPGSDPAK